MARAHRPRFTDPNVPPPGETAVTYGDGLKVTAGPTLELDFGTGHDQAARGDATGSSSVASTDITDSTAAGRAVLTAADAAAQRTALGLGSLATAAPNYGLTLVGSNLSVAPDALSFTATQISDSTPTGRAVLTATDAAAARAAIGVTSSGDPVRTNRRKPATSNTRLLWECDDASGPVANTGSLGSAGDLTAGAALVRRRAVLTSPLSRGIYCNSTSTGQASGAAGVIPTGASASITVWCVADVPSGWSGNQTLIARDYNASGWGAPYIAVMLSLRGGSRGVAHINVNGSYLAVDINLPATSGQILLGLTYDGATLSLWADGQLLGTSSGSGTINWGDAGAVWHLGSNGSNEGFTGTILRAGVEAEVWDAARWAEETLRTRGNWCG
jgi:hypothetical protein